MSKAIHWSQKAPPLARIISGFIFNMLLLNSSCAQNAFAFKQDPGSHVHWIPYLFVLGILFLVLCFLAMRSKHTIKSTTQCHVVEQIALHHKAKVYIVDYQGQRFLIAENPNALAIHPVQEEKSL